MTFGLFSLLFGCGGGTQAPAAPPPAPWIQRVQTWYCGAEALPAGANGAPGGSRDIVVKLTPGEQSILGLYALREGERTYIGSLTRFAATGERAATFSSENSQRQKGDAKASFSEDFQRLTLGWQVGTQPAVTDTVLTATADPSTCTAGALLK